MHGTEIVKQKINTKNWLFKNKAVCISIINHLEGNRAFCTHRLREKQAGVSPADRCVISNCDCSGWDPPAWEQSRKYSPEWHVWAGIWGNKRKSRRQKAERVPDLNKASSTAGSFLGKQTNKQKRNTTRVGEMAQQVSSCLESLTDDLSLIPGTYIEVEGETGLHTVVLGFLLQALGCVQPPTPLLMMSSQQQ